MKIVVTEISFYRCHSCNDTGIVNSTKYGCNCGSLIMFHEDRLRAKPITQYLKLNVNHGARDIINEK